MKENQHALITEYNEETSDRVKRITTIFQARAIESRTKRNREMKKWSWFCIRKYVSDFGPVESEVSQEQHLNGNVQ